MKFIGMILRCMSLMSPANCVMSLENLSPPDADTAVAGEGAVVERACVADSRLVSSDSTYAVMCRIGGSRVILDSNVLVSAFTSLEGASRQLSGRPVSYRRPTLTLGFSLLAGGWSGTISARTKTRDAVLTTV